MDPVSILFIICFGRGFQYHLLDFAVEEEESWAVNFFSYSMRKANYWQPEPVPTTLKTDSLNLQLLTDLAC